MTLKEIENYPKETLNCGQVAPLLGVKYYNLHQWAMEHPETLGFPVIRIRKRILIPRQAFIAFMKGEKNEKD